jgi:arylsulfatase A-like enzyme
MTRRSLLQLTAAAPLAAWAQPSRRPNVVLIVADDLGYGDLGCFGNREVETPHIDRIASEGTRFTNFVVSWPACTPSRSTILTGRYPQRNGLYDMIRNNEVNYKHLFTEEEYAVSPEMTLGLDLREVTVGQVMKSAGYATGVVGKWDSGRAKRFLPLQRGFDFYYGFANTGIDYFTHERYGVPSMFRGNERIKEEGHATDLFRREALRFIDEHHAQPFFLYLPFNAPHGASTFDKSAVQETPEWLARYKGKKNAQYLAFLSHLDDAVGSVMERLRRHGVDENTLVIFTSDNGGSGPEKNGPLRGGKAQMWEGGLRVPMIARWLGRVARDRVSDEFLSTAEFLPSFAAACGAALPKGVKLDGFNMLPVLEGKAKSQRTEFFWQRKNDKAARVGQWKWVESERGSGLFDLYADIGEKNDLSQTKPDVLARVKGRWAAWRKEMDESEPRGPFRDY